MASSPMLGRWGFLPIAVPSALFVSARLGAVFRRSGRAADQLLAGTLLTAALTVGTVRLLGALHRLTAGALLGALLFAAAMAALWPRRRRTVVTPLGQLVTLASAPLLVMALGAVLIAIVAAVWLPVWQWDALGYHLPYVNFLLVAHGFGDVPSDMPYVSTYPHVVELLIAAFRAMLPDDRLVDLAQIPFAIAGALATAGISRRLAAPRSAALAAGAAWILAPAVFLQMPTDYVDVASAALFLTAVYFVLSASLPFGAARATVRNNLLLGGVAVALYIGTKPNAPPSAAILTAVLTWVGLRAGQGRTVLIALVLVLIGSEPFIANTIRYGNPVWPVGLSVGPFVLHGNAPMQHLLDSGAAAPHLRGTLASRIVRSWTAIGSPPVFDMRIGGFGPLVLLAMPVALVTLIRRRNCVTCGAVLASLAAPDPSVARYVLAFPALMLAFAAPRAASLPRRIRPWIGAVAGVLGLAQIVYAFPGLTGEGPPLKAYARLTQAERAQAVGADGPPTRFILARARVAPNETFAFDQSMQLPYLAWPGDLSYRALWIPNSLRSDSAVEEFVDTQNVRVAAVASTSPVGSWMSRRPARFLKLFDCEASSCSVFARR